MADAPGFELISPPGEGETIQVRDGDQGPELDVPDRPVVPLIVGDGIGPDVTGAAVAVLDAAVERTYGGDRALVWFEVPAGEAAKEAHGQWLPEDTFEAIRHYKVALKGPLTTPVGGGFRSLNVTLRQVLDLYANVRPVFHIPGVPSPMREPEQMDIVIFRENTEDVYAGIEWQAGTPEVAKLKAFLLDEMGVEEGKIHDGPVGLGVKPITEFGTKRLVRKAIRHAVREDRESVTLVHKGNIMKYTEGAFRDWGYEVAADEFGDETITEDELWESFDGERPEGTVVVKDRIADNMLQQLITRTSQYDVLAMPNLNGDYISDAAAGTIGGLGMAPGANIGDAVGLFEAVHGTAPKYADQDIANPSSVLFSGVMMLDHLGWREAADRVREAVAKTVGQKRVTQDLSRQMEGVEPLGTSAYAKAIVENL